MRIMQNKIELFCIYGLILSRFGHHVQCLKSDKFYVKQQRTIEQLGMVSVRARSLIECTVLCRSDNDCYSGVFFNDEKQCQMTSQGYPSTTYSNDSLVFVSCLDIVTITTDPPNTRFLLPRLGKTVISQSYLVFKVKSCHWTSIGFLNGTTKVFFVDFGTNNMYDSRINYYNANKKYAYFETPIVNCQNFTYFWVSWNLYTVEVGMGNVVGDNMFLTCDSYVLLPKIDAVNVETAIIPGVWEFEIYAEEC